MNQRDNWDLLQAYATEDSEAAFTELVQRNVNVVHSAAMRQVHDSRLAEEVTQAVFIALVRKAHSLPRATNITGWLYRATRFAAANVLKAERRREQREQKAVQMETGPSDDDRIWQQISPFLDEAMSKLREKDRIAVLLRFFDNKSLAEVGAALGISEAAAKKRVARALEKLRAIFSRRGIVISGTAIGTLFCAKAAPAAPAALTAGTAAIASASGTYAPTALLGIADATLRTMLWGKLRIIALSGAGSAVVAAFALVLDLVNTLLQRL
jgi:RNA polymerase sigma factor (sigma-70 family)